jgi:transposase-like protein
MTKKRELKGIRLLAEKDGIRQVDPSNFLVRSSDPNKTYKVEWQRNHWRCSCADYTKHGKRCKHIYAVSYLLMLRDLTLGVKGLDNEPRCPKCGSDEHIIRRGIRHNRHGPVQRYSCKRCKIRFTGRNAFDGIRSNAATVATAIDLYYRGLSLRQVAQHLETSRGVMITHGTVYNWLKRYVELVNRYVKSLQVRTSERWHADETFVRVRGRHLVMWALLDSETRFLIAMHISQGRGAADARALMKKGLEKSKNEPLEIVTDGLPSYSTAVEEGYKTRQKNRPLIHLQGPLTESLNNKMERLFGTVKGRLKTMCRFNNEESAKRFADGFAAYYNLMKPHRSLKGKTPAQAAGLTPDKSGWLDVIAKAKKSAQENESLSFRSSDAKKSEAN